MNKIPVRPLVSVIIPVHNRFEVALQAIESVILQSYRSLEIIVIDDASSEPFSLANKQDLDIPITIVRLEFNGGPGIARETGRLRASGDFICYLDSDDLFAPQKIEKQVSALIANPQKGMCYCKTAEFKELPIRGDELLRNRNDREFDAFLPILFNGRPWSTSACMWTRSATDLIGPWSDAWTWEDYEYDCRAGCKDIKIICLPEILCFKRSNPEVPQLSSTRFIDATKQQTYSILEMSKCLNIHRKSLEAVTIKYFIYKILKPNLYNLISINEFELAKRICEDIKLFSNRFTKDWSFSNVFHAVLMLNSVINLNSLLRHAANYLQVNR